MQLVSGYRLFLLFRKARRALIDMGMPEHVGVRRCVSIEGGKLKSRQMEAASGVSSGARQQGARRAARSAPQLISQGMPNTMVYLHKSQAETKGRPCGRPFVLCLYGQAYMVEPEAARCILISTFSVRLA